MGERVAFLNSGKILPNMRYEDFHKYERYLNLDDRLLQTIFVLYYCRYLHMREVQKKSGRNYRLRKSFKVKYFYIRENNIKVFSKLLFLSSKPVLQEKCDALFLCKILTIVSIEISSLCRNYDLSKEDICHSLKYRLFGYIIVL